MFIENLHRLMDEKKVTKNKLLVTLGLNKSSILNWEQRGTIPSGEVLDKLANYFGVSVDELLGKEKSPSKSEELVKKYATIINLLESLPEDRAAAFRQQIEELLTEAE